jgi:drug/metabolite transporter (DMT)-like permease
MIYIFIALVFYTLAILTSSYASKHAESNTITAIIHIIAAVVPVLVILPYIGRIQTLVTKQGLISSVLAGIFISIFGLAINKAYAVNNVGIIAPIVFGGSIFLSTILSYFIFGEKVGMIQTFGLLFIFLGLALVIYTRAYGV